MQFNLFDYRETKYCIKFLKKIPALAMSCDKQKLAQLIPCELSFSDKGGTIQRILFPVTG